MTASMAETDDRSDQGGLKAYLLRERPALLRLLVARLGSREEAEDVVQELWLRLSTMSSTPIAQPGGYLFRMANNIATDRRRSAVAGARREQDWIETHGAVDGIEPSVEAGMLASERLRQIDSVIGALPERTARIFRLYRYEEMPRRAVADLVGISVSAVEKHLQTAYRAIHGLVAADGDEREPAKEQGR
jgi:RNA polymerase sigma factor (sigma-70 family)